MFDFDHPTAKIEIFDQSTFKTVHRVGSIADVDTLSSEHQIKYSIYEFRSNGPTI
jgi:hypothetical protein